MVPGRGLQDSEKQSFEIFISPELRTTYDKIYGLVLDQVILYVKSYIEKLKKLLKKLGKQQIFQSL